MIACCEGGCALDAQRARQRATLRWVLGINAVMFVVMVVAAIHGDSSALLADSLDNLGDALTYGLSLYAVSRGARTKARVALFKGGLILLAVCTVAAQIVYRFFHSHLPCSRSWGPSACSACPPMVCACCCSQGIVTRTSA